VSDDEPDNKNAWLQDAIKRAKQSALPLLVREFDMGDPDDPMDVDSLVDAIELALLALTGDVTEAKLREALRPIAEMYAQQIDAKWESVADAILATLEQLPPDKKTHVLDSWGGIR
jgi:hypothetical protein